MCRAKTDLPTFLGFLHERSSTHRSLWRTSLAGACRILDSRLPLPCFSTVSTMRHAPSHVHISNAQPPRATTSARGICVWSHSCAGFLQTRSPRTAAPKSQPAHLMGPNTGFPVSIVVQAHSPVEHAAIYLARRLNMLSQWGKYVPALLSSMATLHGCGCHKKVRVFSLKMLFLKRFTVRSTTRTLIIDKNDHCSLHSYYSGVLLLLLLRFPRFTAHLINCAQLILKLVLVVCKYSCSKDAQKYKVPRYGYSVKKRYFENVFYG
jgi:hypothetical protein